ncbi:hypothetical protein BGZ63DRAFT_353343 [Mariannaea sp. PMI_226]|nr:hypothetical protein BGZ63DRAFT_353343 [Mariannaea sp. PMI_226]
MADKNSTSGSSTGRPRTRQRAYKQPPTLAVPDIDDDAAERKRVLNVLAQRRYRERKRLNRLKPSATGDRDGDKQPNTSVTMIQEPSPSSSTDCQVDDTVHVTVTATDAELTALISSPGIMAGLNMSIPSLDGLLDEPFPILSQPFTPSTVEEENLHQQQSFTTEFNNFSKEEGFTPTIDPSSLTARVSTPTDSYNLPLFQEALLRAMMRIAERLGCQNDTWDLDCISPFNHGTAPPSDQLPVAWRPTSSQILIPHHPMIDFLPWPGARDRILNIMSMPDELRPTCARGPLALVNFAYDVEDSREGVRIYGEDPCEPSSWEVGQILFERWWFLFDREVIATSNRWRRLRGAPPLRLKGPSVSTSSEGR